MSDITFQNTTNDIVFNLSKTELSFEVKDDNNIIFNCGYVGIGIGIPSGGSIGQILAKKSDNNYDTEWVDDKQTLEHNDLVGRSVDDTHPISAITNLQHELDNKTDESNFNTHILNTNNPHQVDKADVGLGNVDNTSDLDKPISTATQTALDGKSDTDHTHSIDDLTDVNTTTTLPITGNVLTWDGSKWIPDKGIITIHNDLTVRDAPSAHPISAITDLQNILNGKSDTDHTHDDRYYTETETNSLLDNKLDITGKAADSDKLDGNDSTYFATATHTHQINDLTDVDTNTNAPADGNVLVWDSGTSKWIPDVGGASSIDDLIDVDTSTNTPTSADTLKWDGTNWVPDNRITTHIADTNNPHSVDKADVGLGNVDNTSDLDKPISTATQTALDGKLDDTAVINDLSDVDISSPSNGAFIRYYSSTGKWQNENTVHNWLDGRSDADAHPISSITNLQSSLDAKLDDTAVLNDLTDVDTGTPTDGQVLTWDDTNSKWTAADGGSGGGDPISGATDNALVRADGSSALQDSGITVSDTDDMVFPATSSLKCPEKLVIPTDEPTNLEDGCIWIA